MFRLKIAPLLIVLLAKHGLPTTATGPTPSLSAFTTVEEPPVPTPNPMLPHQRNYGLFDRPAPDPPADYGNQEAIAPRQAGSLVVTSMGVDPTGDYPALGPPLNSEQVASLSEAASSIASEVSSQLEALTSVVFCTAVTDVNGSPAGSNCALTGAPLATSTQLKNVGDSTDSGWRSWLWVGALPYLLI